jgi:hypothetical protein
MYNIINNQDNNYESDAEISEFSEATVNLDTSHLPDKLLEPREKLDISKNNSDKITSCVKEIADKFKGTLRSKSGRKDLYDIDDHISRGQRTYGKETEEWEDKVGDHPPPMKFIIIITGPV